MERIECVVFKVQGKKEAVPDIILDSSMVEHTAVNRGVVGSSPTRGVSLRVNLFCRLIARDTNGPMVKRLRHRPFTAVTRVRISLGSLWRHSQAVRRGSATP